VNKTNTMIGVIIYDFIVSLFASSLGFAVSGEPITDIPENVGFSLGFLWDTLTAFANLLTFNVAGLPAVFTIIFIYFPNLLLLIILLKFIFNRD